MKMSSLSLLQNDLQPKSIILNEFRMYEKLSGLLILKDLSECLYEAVILEKLAVFQLVK
jgi:hypothetical protein